MVLVQVKRKHGKVLRRHVSQKWDPKTFIISKRPGSKGMVIKVSFYPETLNRTFLKELGVNDDLDLKYIQRFSNIFLPNSTHTFERKLNKTG